MFLGVQKLFDILVGKLEGLILMGPAEEEVITDLSVEEKHLGI